MPEGIAERELKQRVSSSSPGSSAEEGSEFSLHSASVAIRRFSTDNGDKLLESLSFLFEQQRQYADSDSWRLEWVEHGALEVLSTALLLFMHPYSPVCQASF